MSKRTVIGVQVKSFANNSTEVQKVFCEFGCSIRTRIGLHDAAENLCAPDGLILLEFIGGDEKAADIVAKLSSIQGVTVKRMDF